MVDFRHQQYTRYGRNQKQLYIEIVKNQPLNSMTFIWMHPQRLRYSCGWFCCSFIDCTWGETRVCWPTLMGLQVQGGQYTICHTPGVNYIWLAGNPPLFPLDMAGWKSAFFSTRYFLVGNKADFQPAIIVYWSVLSPKNIPVPLCVLMT